VHNIQSKEKKNEEKEEYAVREYTEKNKRQIEYHHITGGHQGMTRTLNRSIIRMLHN